MRLNKSYPAMARGYNNFVYERNGTYMYDPYQRLRCQVTTRHSVRFNYFEHDGQADRLPDARAFCPSFAFIIGDLQSNPLVCFQQGAALMEAPELLYQAASAAEADSNFSTAQQTYDQIMQTYPESHEAYWSTRGYLRSGLEGSVQAATQHDSLYALWQNDIFPFDVRAAARREAIWALIAGWDWDMARTELQAITSEPANDDSLWAVVTTELMNLLEQGGSIQSIGHEQLMQARLASFHDRLHQLMGRETDGEVLAQAALPKSHDLASAYPNPFNSTVTIRFELPQAGLVRIEIYNLLGQKIAKVLDQRLEAGTYTRQWNASDVPSGVYFYRFMSNRHFETHKLLLLK